MPTETDICNLGLMDLGGAGDQNDGKAFIGNIDDNNDVARACKIAFPRIRRQVLIEFAADGAPFRNTIRFEDLGTELSSTPEIANYEHAFNLPGDCLEVVAQFDEDSIADRYQPSRYEPPDSGINFQFEVIANADGTGKILVTNTLSNTARTSAFIEYVIDTPKTDGFSEGLIDCIATKLASKVAPMVGRDMEAGAVMLERYERVVKPKAKKANQRGLNNSEKPVSGYDGGRTKQIRSIT